MFPQNAIMALLAKSRLSFDCWAFSFLQQTLTIINVLQFSYESDVWRSLVSLHSRYGGTSLAWSFLFERIEKILPKVVRFLLMNLASVSRSYIFGRYRILSDCGGWSFVDSFFEPLLADACPLFLVPFAAEPLGAGELTASGVVLAPWFYPFFASLFPLAPFFAATEFPSGLRLPRADWNIWSRAGIAFSLRSHPARSTILSKLVQGAPSLL